MVDNESAMNYDMFAKTLMINVNVINIFYACTGALLGKLLDSRSASLKVGVKGSP